MTRVGKVVALIVAAGSGTRVGGGVPKQYAPIGGKAMLAEAIDRIAPLVDAVHVVIGQGQDQAFADAVGARALPAPIIGGATRQISVRNGLEALAREGGIATVLIHDAARPFLPAEVVQRLLAALETHPGAVPILPVIDSLARSAGTLGDSIDRDAIVRVQTPQAFAFDAILAAHRAYAGPDATDDAQVLRAAGHIVATVMGDGALEKLTFAEDFARMEQALWIGRTGLGFDVHAFAEGESLWLGGVEIPHDRGLAGHSDADVVLHALTDALLGTIGEGDIGDHFPPGDPQWRGAASALFLRHARTLIAERGGRIDHVDITIICEAPKIGPHRARIRESIAGLLGLPLSRVSVKATTTERLGFTGRGEGIAVQAIATVRAPEEV